MMADGVPRDGRAWVLGAAVVLAAHALAVVALLRVAPMPLPGVEVPPAVLLDLAELPAPAVVPVAEPAPVPVPEPPAPLQAAEPPPEAVQDPAPPASPALAPTPVLERAEVVVPPAPRPAPPRPRPRVVRPVQRETAVAPRQEAAAPAPVAVAPARPAAAPAGHDPATWSTVLAAHLLRFRRYPPEAERRGFAGVAVMRFTVDAGGRVMSSDLVRSSGHEVLDDEARAWLLRAQPLPAPPPERVAPAVITVPLSFVLR